MGLLRFLKMKKHHRQQSSKGLAVGKYREELPGPIQQIRRIASLQTSSSTASSTYSTASEEEEQPQEFCDNPAVTSMKESIINPPRDISTVEKSQTTTTTTTTTTESASSSPSWPENTGDSKKSLRFGACGGFEEDIEILNEFARSPFVVLHEPCSLRSPNIDQSKLTSRNEDMEIFKEFVSELESIPREFFVSGVYRWLQIYAASTRTQKKKMNKKKIDTTTTISTTSSSESSTCAVNHQQQYLTTAASF